jgi:hypothetical protein
MQLTALQFKGTSDRARSAVAAADARSVRQIRLKDMLTLTLIGLGVLIVLTEILWRRTSQFLLYRGESRIRRGRSLAHLASDHYRPEGYRWLRWYRLAYVATTIAFLLVFFVLTSRLLGRTA